MSGQANRVVEDESDTGKRTFYHQNFPDNWRELEIDELYELSWRI